MVTTKKVPATSATRSPEKHSSIKSGVDEYRSVNKAAVACIVCAILALAAFAAQVFIILPVLGVGFGLSAIASIRKYPDEFVGASVAKIGLIINGVVLVGAIAMHIYIYATECPEDYRRISFGELADNAKTSLPFSEKAQELDGQQVFIKGYVRPPSGKKKRLKNFIMVGDFGDCCFGGTPKITDVISVRINTQDTVDYSYGLRRIGGKFKLNPNTAPASEKEVPQVFYEIEADYVR